MVFIFEHIILFRHLQLQRGKAFVPKAETCFVPVKKFQFVATLAAKQKQRPRIERPLYFEFDNGGKAIDLFSKIDEIAMQINFWCIHKHFHASCPINFASQTTSVELGMDRVALPILRVIAAVGNLDVSATVNLLKLDDLTLVSACLDFSQLLRRA
jgi:hypothetical protein